MQFDLLRKLIEEHPQLMQRGGVFRSSAVHESSEWMRIVSLPKRELDLDATPDLTPLWAKHGSTMKLWPIQSAALLEAERSNGLFAMLPVGSGKTLLASLLPDAMKSERAVILVPAQLKRRTLEETWPALQKHFRLPLERVTLVSYSQLERAPGDVLERLKPDLVIADEAHMLKHKTAARTWRWLEYMKTNSLTRFVAMTGTPSNKSILEYAHLLWYALKQGSPLPREYMTLCEWAESLDVNGTRDAGALERLCENVDHLHEDHRSKYGCRLVSTPGVVSLPSGFDGALTVRRFPLEVPPNVTAAVERLRKSWEIGNPETPEDPVEEINDDLTYSRYIRQLGLGFYLRWDWPQGKRDTEWLEARSRWGSVVRHVLRYQRTSTLTSPMLVANAAIRGELAKEQLDVWAQWDSVRGRKKPPTVCVWISKYAVDVAAQWAQSTEGAIVWYAHVPMGEAISAALGQPLCEQVSDLVFDGKPKVLSLGRFGKGVDGLQRDYARALYTAIPNGEVLEQSLGRIHRSGQKQEVIVDMLLPIEESMSILNTTKAQTRYAQGSERAKKKLLNCITEGLELDT